VTRTSAVVIGAGMGGMAAAIDLARAGVSVTVLEAASEAGGKVGRAVHDGVEFDTGPSVLTMPDVLKSLLDSDRVDLIRHDRVCTYHWPDGASFDVHADQEATLSSAEATFGARARDELAAFLRYSESIWRAAAPVFVYGDAPSAGYAVRLGPRRLATLRHIDPLRTMEEAIRSFVREPHLIDVLMRYATYNGSDPRRAPATLNCIAHVELALGSWGVRGGMFEIVGALHATATSLGVEFVFDSPAQRIDTHVGMVASVHTDTTTYPADAVVANADVAHVLTDLLGQRAAEREPSTSGWTAVLRARRRDCAPNTVLFPADYRAEFRDLFDRRVSPSDPSVYVCAQERAHQRRGWPHHEPLFVMANAPAAAREDESLPERVLARLRTHGLVDDDPIVWSRTPHELAQHFPGSHGAIYGAASNSPLAAFQRPANRCTNPRGLYFASGSAHPGGGVPLCLLSGRAAARAVLRKHGR